MKTKESQSMDSTTTFLELTSDERAAMARAPFSAAETHKASIDIGAHEGESRLYSIWRE